MTSLAREIEIAYPGCGLHYHDWHRPSINLGLGEWSAERLREAMTATCRLCGFLGSSRRSSWTPDVWRRRR